MSNENDLMKLYSQRILALAAEIPHTGRLDAPQASVKKRSPLCGSTVTVDVDVEDGKVSRYAADVKACALGQASASVVGSAAIGRTSAEINKAREELKAMPTAPMRPRHLLMGLKRCCPRGNTKTAMRPLC